MSLPSAEPDVDPYSVRSFEDFWPHYLRLHSRRETQVMHAVATLSCVGLLGAAVILRQPALAVAAPLVDFAIAQASHRLFEANRTTPWKNQIWHTRAELRMLLLVLTGRLDGAGVRAVTSCATGRRAVSRSDRSGL